MYVHVNLHVLHYQHFVYIAHENGHCHHNVILIESSFLIAKHLYAKLLYVYLAPEPSCLLSYLHDVDLEPTGIVLQVSWS